MNAAERAAPDGPLPAIPFRGSYGATSRLPFLMEPVSN
jgi:hypothetical protein